MRSGFAWSYPFVSFWLLLFVVALPALALAAADRTSRGARWELWLLTKHRTGLLPIPWAPV